MSMRVFPNKVESGIPLCSTPDTILIVRRDRGLGGQVRDDFSVSVKDELAKRVSFLCSNPACRQPTSGPQSAPEGTVNVGVAAHITAASPGGPRYDASLTPAERASASNGIWLCQTCAKLIDSDQPGFTTDKLREWKSAAESAAARALAQRRAPASESGGVFLEAERLMPELIARMREAVRSDDTELIREFVVLPSRNVMFSSRKPRWGFSETEIPNLRLQVDWLEEMGCVVDVTPGNAPIYRMVPEFVEWLRGSA